MTPNPTNNAQNGTATVQQPAWWDTTTESAYWKRLEGIHDKMARITASDPGACYDFNPEAVAQSLWDAGYSPAGEPADFWDGDTPETDWVIDRVEAIARDVWRSPHCRMLRRDLADAG